jgi:hypothetical protein
MITITNTFTITVISIPVISIAMITIAIIAISHSPNAPTYCHNSWEAGCNSGWNM